MAIAEGNTTSVSSADVSDWVKLVPGTNRIYVSSAAWSTSVVVLEASPDASTPYPLDNPGSFGTQLECTTNTVFDVSGPCYIRMECTTYGGTAITLLATNPVDDRL